MENVDATPCVLDPLCVLLSRIAFQSQRCTASAVSVGFVLKHSLA